jgi:hypothetical protein
MKSKLKAPGTERLILKHDNLLLRCAFKINLRRCRKVALVDAGVRKKAGDMTAYVFLPGGLGRAVQADPFKPTLKAPGSMLLKLRSDEPVSNFAF